ncbi:DUF2380 domain-containing protein [Methylomonas sp. AM2-LC]|uniref:DUF2380 domain-containing protein n=1 Tax=Methylomonas sp. AM2-LC TaxID=3153301 RepID=UPI003262FB2D
MRLLVFLLFSLHSLNVSAMPRIAILDFELKDMTLAPGISAERERTASVKPLLENALKSAGYQLISIPLAAQQAANSGVGYLFDHADSAAKLGKEYGADYLLVGRLHKPSFLFVYLMGNLVNTHTGVWLGNFITESKGGDIKLTQKAVESLAVKMDKVLEQRYTPPAPNRLTSMQAVTIK